MCLFETLDKKAMNTWRLLERGRTYANHSDGATEVLRITVASLELRHYACIQVSTEHFEEPPQSKPAQYRDRYIVVPSEYINHFARARDQSAPKTHDA